MKRTLRMMIAIASASICTNAAAGIDFEPHIDWPAPLHFSGTNSRAFYKATVTYPTVHIERAEIYVDNELTLWEVYPVQGLPPRQVYRLTTTLKIMFDSTHFPNSGITTIKMRVRGDGIWYEHSYSAIRYNRAGAFGLHSFETTFGGAAATKVKDRLDQIQHYCDLITYSGWDHSIVDTIEDHATIHYFNTHGTEYSFQTDAGGLIYPFDSYGSPDLRTWPEASIGSGYPPFNSTGNPPVHLAVFDSCKTGSSSLFASILFPAYNGYGGLYENQAIAGWTVSPLISDSELLAALLWNPLIDQEVLDAAIISMIGQATLFNIQVYDSLTYRTIQDGDFVSYADGMMRVHGVYTNSSLIHSDWWWQLP